MERRGRRGGEEKKGREKRKEKKRGRERKVEQNTDKQIDSSTEWKKDIGKNKFIQIKLILKNKNSILLKSWSSGSPGLSAVCHLGLSTEAF
jgi:hypothetical protein